MRRWHRGEKGFTLIELLIVIAILGIIAAVVIPNAANFFATGTLNAANSEAENVKTAAIAFYAEGNPPTWPATSADLEDTYITGTLKAVYTFDDDGLISDADPTGGWGDDIEWDDTTYHWVKATSE